MHDTLELVELKLKEERDEGEERGLNHRLCNITCFTFPASEWVTFHFSTRVIF